MGTFISVQIQRSWIKKVTFTVYIFNPWSSCRLTALIRRPHDNLGPILVLYKWSIVFSRASFCTLDFFIISLLWFCSGMMCIICPLPCIIQKKTSTVINLPSHLIRTLHQSPPINLFDSGLHPHCTTLVSFHGYLQQTRGPRYRRARGWSSRHCFIPVCTWRWYIGTPCTTREYEQLMSSSVLPSYANNMLYSSHCRSQSTSATSLCPLSRLPPHSNGGTYAGKKTFERRGTRTSQTFKTLSHARWRSWSETWCRRQRRCSVITALSVLTKVRSILCCRRRTLRYDKLQIVSVYACFICGCIAQ